MASLPDVRGHQIYEDIGALKALMSSIDAKLDAGGAQFREIREDQSRMRVEVAEMKATGVVRAEATARIEETMETVVKRVDELVALRNRFGGALFILTLLSGSIYAAWSTLERFITQIGK